ncbi:MAG: hypothetical protein JRF33_21850 [Deltaproteobacteria bacterium]|nr:hypothetical protein [Deltaproteobacteria bacterium]
MDEATKNTVELIDVLWLQKHSIQAAFEIECTTSIYSGLLRMSDLLTLQPNLDIKLFIVAPDVRQTKVENEIKRPTFAMLDKPLPEVCGFIPFSKLTKKFEVIRKNRLAPSLNADFLNTIASYYSGRA